MAFGRGFGQIGVMLFFVLSGFLMAHLYARNEFDSIQVRRYALARIGRVVPLYLMVLFISIIASNYVFPDFYYSFEELPSTLLAITFIKAPYVFWTIPVEVQFYCMFVGFWFGMLAALSVLLILVKVSLISSSHGGHENLVRMDRFFVSKR